MKKKIAILLACVMLFATLAACGGDETPAETATPADSVAPADSAAPAEGSELSGTVTLGGSTSVESVILSAAEAFMTANPDVSVTYNPTGSSSGVTGALDGTLDIGLASRDVKDAEVESGAMGTVFAIDGIAIIVHPENTVADLSLADITAIADGSVTNWSEFGGADSEIVLVGREAGSGTRDGFESIVGVDECAYAEEIPSGGGVVGSVSANPNAIGYTSLSAVNETVKALTVDGVAPSEATIQDGSYAVQRNFNFVTLAEGEMTAEAQAFMDFVLSADAAELISNAGAVPPAA